MRAGGCLNGDAAENEQSDDGEGDDPRGRRGWSSGERYAFGAKRRHLERNCILRVKRSHVIGRR